MNAEGQREGRYIVDDGIDFYEALKTDIDIKQDANICLITNDTLAENYVKLLCGHTFNYIPLMKDLYGANDTKRSKTARFILRCPYCRAVQTEVLPYYNGCGIPYMNGVHISKEETKRIKDEEKRQKAEEKKKKAEEKKKMAEEKKKKPKK